MIQPTINFAAVFVAALASFIIGYLWYSTFFGTTYMRLMGMTKKSMKSMKMSATKAMSYGFIVALIMAYVLAHFVDYFEATTMASAFQVAFWIWLGFSVPLTIGSYLWEGKPCQIFLINASYRFVELVVMAAILVMWV